MKSFKIFLSLIFILFFFQTIVQAQYEISGIETKNGFSDLPDSAITITTIDGVKYRHSRLIDWNVETPLNMLANPICVGDWTGNRNIEFGVVNQTKIDKFYIEFTNVGFCSKVTYETWPVTISNRSISITFYYPSSGSLSGTFAQSGNYINGSFNYSNSSCGGSINGSWEASPVTPCVYPPEANFSGSPTSGLEPLDVQFTDKSTGDITSRSWNFGDSGSSTAKNPNHIYSTHGIYTVSLTVTGPGGEDTKTRKDYINVIAPAPIANFVADTTYGLKPLTVQFTDSSTGAITSWDWDFGDDSTSTEQNPSHTYETADTFTVSLTVTGPGGEDTKTREDYITVIEPAPTANFGADTTYGLKPLIVQFTDSSTGAITSWDWDFGDDSTSTEQNPSHTYETADTFTVSLSVTGPGGSDTATRENYIVVIDPTDVDSHIHQLPTSFLLYQNFPNPFNPLTVIKYSVKEACQVKLRVFNIQGQTIQNLVDKYQNRGVYRIVFNTVDLASGIYFYKIQMGDFTDIKKMVKIE